jgi:hypothetical protein
MKAIQDISYKEKNTNSDCILPMLYPKTWFFHEAHVFYYKNWCDFEIPFMVANFKVEHSSQIEISFPQKKISKFEIKYQKFQKNKIRFNELLPELLKKYRNKFVAIIDENIEIGENEDSLLENVIKKYGSQTMYVSKIAEKKRIVRIGRPKLMN